VLAGSRAWGGDRVRGGRSADELPTEREQLGDAIGNMRFKSRRLRESYDMGAVDTLLDELEAAVLSGAPMAPLLPGSIKRVKIREGYDIEQVDEFLAKIRARG
jgi:DivIVA domain-containing protein